MSRAATGGEQSVVFVVDDDPEVRDALEDLLASVGLEVQLFASAQEFLNGRRPDAPACLVLDVRMPGMSGLELQREMAARNISYPVIFISGHGNTPMSVRSMKAGAIEFLTKPFSDQDLLDAIQLGLDKDRTRHRDAAALAELQAHLADLTRGERDVLERVVGGLLNKQIAAELGVSEITVKVRRAHLMRKMRARSQPELVRMADRLGIAAGDLGQAGTA
jgi:FixJ family two-component response regulator